MASSNAVRPLGTVQTSLLWMSSTEEVKSTSTSGFSEKVIRKNSSWGLAVREKFDHRLARFVDLVAHRAADIKDDAQRYGRVFAGEMPDLLRGSVIGELKILFLQPGHQPVHRIGNGHRDQH